MSVEISCMLYGLSFLEEISVFFISFTQIIFNPCNVLSISVKDFIQ